MMPDPDLQFFFFLRLFTQFLLPIRTGLETKKEKGIFLYFASTKNKPVGRLAFTFSLLFFLFVYCLFFFICKISV